LQIFENNLLQNYKNYFNYEVVMQNQKSINYSIQINYPREEIARIQADEPLERDEKNALMLIIFNEFFKQLKLHNVFDENIIEELQYLIEGFFDDLEIDDFFEFN
jgi:hypothetical protein